MYKEYKKKSKPQKLNRYYENDIPSTYENRNFQLRTLISLLSHTPVCQTYISGAEADDAIGYLCKYLLKEKNKIIVSSDHDFYQLIDDNTIIWSPTLKSFVNKKKVLERFGVHPNNFSLAKSVTGDVSDNIPGVKGVGYKSLSKRLQKFSASHEYMLYDMITDAKSMIKPKGPKIFENIVNSEDLIKRNNRLVLLDTNNLSLSHMKKLESDIENFEPAYNNMNIHKHLKSASITSIDLSRWNYLLKNLKKGTIK